MQEHGPGIAMGISDVAPPAEERGRVTAPIDAEVDAPIDAEVDAPIDAEVGAPIDAAIGAPIGAPIDAAIDAPATSDDDDDDSPWVRRGREDEDRPGGPLPDPDQVERQKRVEVYRKLWEQDSTRSLFVRPDSPPPRPWKPANTWGTGRL